jgi:hypothetical protein
VGEVVEVGAAEAALAGLAVVAALAVVAVEVALAGSVVVEGLEVAVVGRAGDEDPGSEKTKQARSRLR